MNHDDSGYIFPSISESQYMILNKLPTIFAVLILATGFIPQRTCAQSDPSLFSTVINVPPDHVPASIGSNTQFNVSEGGSVNSFFDAGAIDGSSINIEVNISGGSVGAIFDAFSESTVNISGGVVGHGFDANSGSTVNIRGGSVGATFNAFPGSTVNISGGSVGIVFEAFAGSDVELIGGEFQLNGSDFTGSMINLSNQNDVFSGTLADGSSFIFTPASADRLLGVSLTTTALPTLDLSPIVVDAINPVGPNGLRSGQTLTLKDGGELKNNFAVTPGTFLNIEGGNVGQDAEVALAEANISGGTIGIGFNATSGSNVNIRGGVFEGHFNAQSGGTVNISGGNLGANFDAASGSIVNIRGGVIGDNFDAFAGSEINLYGTQFFLNGVRLQLSVNNTSEIPQRGGAILSGIFDDGSAFSFDLNDRFVFGEDRIDANATLTITLVPEPASLTLVFLTLPTLLGRLR